MRGATKMIGELYDSFYDSIHTFSSKLLMGVSAPSIAFHLNELLPDFIAEPLIWIFGRLYSIEWVETLSTVAIIMLIIERYYAIKLNIAKRRNIK